MQVVGRRLVLDVRDVGLDGICQGAHLFGQSPTPGVDFGVDVVDARGNEMRRTGLAAGEDVHVDLQRGQRRAEGMGVVAHAALHGRVFAGEKEHAHGKESTSCRAICQIAQIALSKP